MSQSGEVVWGSTNRGTSSTSSSVSNSGASTERSSRSCTARPATINAMSGMLARVGCQAQVGMVKAPTADTKRMT